MGGKQTTGAPGAAVGAARLYEKILGPLADQSSPSPSPSPHPPPPPSLCVRPAPPFPCLSLRSPARALAVRDVRGVRRGKGGGRRERV